MKKIEKEYNDHYGSIPKDETERFAYLLKTLNLRKRASKSISTRIQELLNAKWASHNFTIWLVPAATPRPRHNSRFNFFYVTGAKINKDIFHEFMEQHKLPMITTPCKFTCISYLPTPKSMNSDEKVLAEMGLVRPTSKPDFDNLAKTYADMIQDSLIYDDALIVEGKSSKFYSIKPRIEIRIEYMTNYDSTYNEKKIRKKVKDI